MPNHQNLLTQGDKIATGEIQTFPIEKLGIRGGNNIGFGIKVRIENEKEGCSNSSGTEKCYRMYFDRLDKGGNTKNNYKNKKKSSRNYVRFAVKSDGTIEIWGMHLEDKNHPGKIGLRGIKDSEGVGPSKVIFNYFLEYFKELGHTNFTTGSIHKPIFAKILTESGFIPNQKDIGCKIVKTSEHKEIERKIESRISKLRSQINEIEQDILELRSKDISGGKIQKLHGTLQLSPEQQKILELQNKKNGLSDSIDLILRVQNSISKAIQEGAPLVHWYGLREEMIMVDLFSENKTKQMTPPRNIGDDAKHLWFQHISINTDPEEFPLSDPEFIYLDTGYHYIEGSDEVPDNISKRVSAILKHNSI